MRKITIQKGDESKYRGIVLILGGIYLLLRNRHTSVLGTDILPFKE